MTVYVNNELGILWKGVVMTCCIGSLPTLTWKDWKSIEVLTM